ncbi:MAG: (2Fe-2S)-binding protein, partial [Cellvibrionaceae bacterium]|nr:(2Fe-2S)-binding protein [Cellvibrionaceae bacterium]
PKDGPSGKVFVGERFSTPTGRAVLWPIEPRLPVQAADKDYPWTLNSGRLRDHWHTMTRTGRVANLNSHIDRPCIYLNPADFAELGLQLGELVSARSKAGQVVAFAQASEDIARRQCFMPIHWSAQFASAANVSSVYASVADPISGQPESKQAAVQLAKFDCAQYLHIYSRCELKPAADFWVKSQAQTGYHYLLAMAEPRTQLSSWVQGLLGQNSKVTEWLGGTNSLLGMAAGRVELLAFADAQPLTLNKTWIEHWFDFEALELAQVGAILRRQVAPEFLQGAKVCSCFGVHQQPIIDAIEAGADSVEALGQQLRCGTNCGSCKPELASLLQQHKPSTVAERSLQL